jgi:4-alpha-glucanotransferase
MEDYRWLRERARRGADLFDGYRVDHLVGFYRTYGRPKNGGEPFFTPADERSQQALGERVLEIFRGAGAEIVAEDLGTVPDFVRASLARLGVPGFRVFRWERYWHSDGQPFRDPADYPAASVATSGTHDTEPLIVWWERASDDERHKVAALPTIQRIAGANDFAYAPYDTKVRDVVLEALFGSGSYLLLLPLQDVFGWRDRINEPATVGDHNWSFRLPWASDQLNDVPQARERQATLARWSSQYARARHG